MADMNSTTSNAKIKGFIVQDNSIEGALQDIKADLLITLDNVFTTSDNGALKKTLQDVLFGRYESYKDEEYGLWIQQQTGYYPVNINNTSIWQELSYFEQDLARRLFGIYVPYELETGEKIQAYIGSFLDKQAIKVQDMPVQDENGNWYFPEDLDNGNRQFVTANDGRILTAIEAYYTIPGFEMQSFETDGGTIVYYPVKIDPSLEWKVGQDFAEYLYNSLNFSSLVQDILDYSRFWNTLASEDFQDEATVAVVSKKEIESLFNPWVVNQYNNQQKEV